ncbi:MAG: hypothetical protein LC808_41680 [Actinobacteria bacterium]|nr:hypothetical protein [Actinomycetota bacterium]
MRPPQKMATYVGGTELGGFDGRGRMERGALGPADPCRYDLLGNGRIG